MKRFITMLSICAGTTLSISSCGVASIIIGATGIALSTAAAVGESAVFVHNLNTYVGSHKTTYAFELVNMTNDGGIKGGKVTYPIANTAYRAEYRDNLIDFTFCYKDNCLVPAFKGKSNHYLTINWNDIVMAGTEKLLWKDGNSNMSTITKAGYNEADLYVLFDSVSGTYRTLPLFTSQKKANKAKLVGQVFTLNFPIINIDKVITYTATIKITSVVVN